MKGVRRTHIYKLLVGVGVLLLCAATALGQSAYDEHPPQVWQIKVQGNDAFSDILIKDQIATTGYSFFDKLKFWRRKAHTLDQTELKKDAIRIRNFYNRRGFPNVHVAQRVETLDDPWKRRVVFTVNEQAPIRIDSVYYSFSDSTYREQVLDDQAFRNMQRKSKLKEGDRYEIIKLPEVVSAYEQTLKNMGYAYAKVTTSAEVDTAGLTADLTINSDTGPVTYLDSIRVSGDSLSTDRYVIKESGLRKGRRYSLGSIQDAQREIFNHHLFRFATIEIPEQPHDSTLNLVLRVRENELRTVKTSVGFGTEEYLRGQVSWTYRNAFNRAHQFTVFTNASFIEQSLNLSYLFPYAFNTKSSFLVSPFAQHLLEPGYELWRVGLTNSFIYRYSQNLTGSASYQYTHNAEISVETNASLPDTTQSYDLSSLQFSGYYNEGFGRRNQEGWVIQPYAEISGFLGTATYQFQKLSMDVRRYTPVTGTTTIATRLQGGKIFAANEDSLPNNVRYYVGGTNSVRGWVRRELGPKTPVLDGGASENANFDRYIPTGGRTFVGFNVEIRQDIGAIINNFGITAFLDGGQVWRENPDFGLRPLQYGIGGGLRYNSPIGPVRLDLGYKVNPSDADLNRFRGEDYGGAWDRYALHVSLGQAF